MNVCLITDLFKGSLSSMDGMLYVITCLLQNIDAGGTPHQ